MDDQQDDQNQSSTPADDSAGGMGAGSTDNGTMGGGSDMGDQPQDSGDGEIAPPTPVTEDKPMEGEDMPPSDAPGGSEPAA